MEYTGSMGCIGGADGTFACKSQECLWQDWCISITFVAKADSIEMACILLLNSQGAHGWFCLLTWHSKTTLSRRPLIIWEAGCGEDFHSPNFFLRKSPVSLFLLESESLVPLLSLCHGQLLVFVYLSIHFFKEPPVSTFLPLRPSDFF